MQKKLAVISLGGHAIQSENLKGSYLFQLEQVRKACIQFVELVRKGWQLLIVHGNGPQIGEMLYHQLCIKAQPLPLDALGARTQGELGYVIVNELHNAFKSMSEQNVPPIAALVTRTVVDDQDIAFSCPDKPIGPYVKEELIPKYGSWGKQFSPDKGWRVTVPSPKPLQVKEAGAIQLLLSEGYHIVAGGGGGIPITEKEGKVTGLQAVVDKDRIASLLAQKLRAQLLILLTGVGKVSVNFNRPNQKDLDRMTVGEALAYLLDGQFGKGSMGPKIESAIDFINNAPGEALITNIDGLSGALQHRAGTWICSA